MTKHMRTKGGIPYTIEVEEKRWPRWITWPGAVLASLAIWGAFYWLYLWLEPMVHK